MKSYSGLVLAGVLGALGCVSETAQQDASQPDESPVVGAVRGTVRDASTEQALIGVELSAGELGVQSDAAGSYGLAPLQPGSLKVGAYRRGFAPESVTAFIEPGVTALIDFPLIPAQSPCCELTGVWSATVVLDSAGLNVTPAAREALGEIVFDEVETEDGLQQVHEAIGASRVDFASLLGPQVGSEDSARGVVFGGDSVAITVVPRFADWGIELLGRVNADTVSGIWYQRASCCGAYGTFRLVRTAVAE